MFPEALDVELDRLADELHGLGTTLTDSNTTGEIRHVCTNRCLSLLDDHDIFHGITLRLLQPCLLPDASESSLRHIDTEVARDRHRTRLRRVAILSVTTARSYEQPAV